MEVEYELTRDDLYAFQWRAGYTSSRARRDRLKVYLSLLSALLVFFVFPGLIGGEGFSFSNVNLIVFALSFTIMAVFAWWYLRRALRRAIIGQLNEEKPGRGQLGRHKIRLTETEIVETTDVGESRTNWVGVDRIEQNDDYIFVYTTPHSAHVIPKRAFDSAGQAASFYQLARVSKEAAGLYSVVKR
jgi:ABC-type nickel/cobalt efflux system permease component RcnA